MNMTDLPTEVTDEPETQQVELSERQRAYLAAVPLSWRKVATKVLSGNGTPSQERRVKCGDCAGWDRDSIRLCTVTICAHHSRRPFQK